MGPETAHAPTHDRTHTNSRPHAHNDTRGYLQVGISYDAGKLEVLLPGLHIRKSPTFRFREFVSVQEQVRHLEPLKVNTNDGIAILVNAIITYRVEDPVRAYRVLFLYLHHTTTFPPS